MKYLIFRRTRNLSRMPSWLPGKRGEKQEESSFPYPVLCFYSHVQFVLEAGLVEQHC